MICICIHMLLIYYSMTINLNTIFFYEYGFECDRNQNIDNIIVKEKNRTAFRDRLRNDLENPIIKKINEKTEKEWLLIEKKLIPSINTAHKNQLGVAITDVFQRTDAYKKGLRKGDVILSVNGFQTNYIYELQLALRTVVNGKISMSISRNNKNVQ